MVTLLDCPDVVQCEELGPTDADLAAARAYHAATATLPPPAEPRVPLLDWVQSERLAHGVACDDGDVEMGLVVGALTRLWCAVEMHRPRTVGALLRTRSVLCHGIDLSAVRVPASRVSPVAQILDAEARRYLGMGSELATLAAWYVLRVADDCERFESTSVESYLIDKAALEAAWEDAADDGFPDDL